MHPKTSWTSLIWALYQVDNAKDYENMPIHLPSNQSVGEGGTKEEKIWRRDRSWAENGTYHETGWRQVQGLSLSTERSWEMNQSDKGPEGNEEVCSTTEVQYAEKNG